LKKRRKRKKKLENIHSLADSKAYFKVYRDTLDLVGIKDEEREAAGALKLIGRSWSQPLDLPDAPSKVKRSIQPCSIQVVTNASGIGFSSRVRR